MIRKIGIFSGVFDPVHSGHVGLALKAIDEAGLDEVYFLVESKPRRKEGVTHIAHRLAMVKLAIAPYRKLKVLELPDKQFSVAKTLPRLKQKFADQELYFICGSDMIGHMPKWELIEIMLVQAGLIVGIRNGLNKDELNAMIANLPVKPKSINIITSPAPNISSGQIRVAVGRHKKANGLLAGTSKYIKEHWLYALVSDENSDS